MQIVLQNGCRAEQSLYLCGVQDESLSLKPLVIVYAVHRYVDWLWKRVRRLHLYKSSMSVQDETTSPDELEGVKLFLEWLIMVHH